MVCRLPSRLTLSGHPGYWLLLMGVLGIPYLCPDPTMAESGQVKSPSLQISQATPTSAPASTRPVLEPGARGSDISELQATLKLLGFYRGPVDGVYNQPTVDAVSQFQRVAGLTPDGVVGPATWNRLYPPASGAPTPTYPPVATAPTPSRPINPTPSRPTPSPQKPAPSPVAQKPSASADFPVLRKGMKGPAVVSLQERLQAAGLLKGGADGVFGDETEAAVKAAQEKYGLEVDGIAGPATWRALLKK